MKNKLVVLIMILLTLVFLVSGCGNAEEDSGENENNKAVEEVVEKETQKNEETDEESQQGESNIEGIKNEISSIKPPNEFNMVVEGASKGSDFEFELKYDIYYRNNDVRIDTYWEDKAISSAIYNEKDDATYVHTMNYTDYAEYSKGNLLPIRLIDVDFLEGIEMDTSDMTLTANYETFEGEKVLYIKSSINNGVTTEMWYSLEYLVPIKFHEVSIDEDGKEEIDWQVVRVDETTPIDDDVFYIPDDIEINENSADDYYGDDDYYEDDDWESEDDYSDEPMYPTTEEQSNKTRELLLYKVDYIDAEDVSMLDMTQIFYYSNESYENLVKYFKGLLEDTEDYYIMEEDKKTSFDGTLNGNPVIVIVNNYMKYEPEVDGNGVNVNYY
ncbi:hypothetical protein [Clostridium sp. DL1XJH146]